MNTFFDITSTIPDSDLVQMARNRNRSAFDQLVCRHRSASLRFAISLLHDRSEAEEEVQNAFMKAFEHLDQFRGDAEFSSWLLRIVANHCLMRLRLRARVRLLYLDGDSGREGEGQIEVPSTATDPEFDLIQTQMAGVVQREIRRIPKLLRNVVMLRDVEHLPMSDVAQRLGITVPAAKSRLFRARTELRHRVLQSCGSRGYYMPRSSVQDLPARATRCPIPQA
jgi:RNA polymerase sigma-70 factor (ECF subfamily)